MIESEENGRRELANLVAPRVGRLEATGQAAEPYRLLDSGGVVVGPVAVFLRELLAAGRSVAMLRSYGWTYCGGGGSCMRSISAGTARPDSKPAISAAGSS